MMIGNGGGGEAQRSRAKRFLWCLSEKALHSDEEHRETLYSEPKLRAVCKFRCRCFMPRMRRQKQMDTPNEMDIRPMKANMSRTRPLLRRQTKSLFRSAAIKVRGN